MHKTLSGLGLALAVAAGGADAAPTVTKKMDAPFAKERIVWNQPQPPFHLIGNIYYVGPAGVSAFLIVTPKGDILTDGGLPESAPLIERNIAALGFKLSDVKIMLNSHAHFDHAGGLAELKRKSGAELYASAGDAPILESGHIAFGPAAKVDFPPVHVDHVVQEGETLSVGGVRLTAHLTPGHTPGCTSWSMKLTESGVRHEVLFFCSITVAGNPLVGNTAHPQIVSEYRASFAKLKKLNPDIFLAPHGAQFGLAGKIARMKPGAANPFIEAGEFHRFIGGMEQDFDTELTKQQAAAKH